MSCEICCATFNDKHKEVGCPYCALRACRSCATILIETNEDPHCMGVSGVDRKYGLPCARTFVDVDYKRRRDVLFERERACSAKRRSRSR